MNLAPEEPPNLGRLSRQTRDDVVERQESGVLLAAVDDLAAHGGLKRKSSVFPMPDRERSTVC